MNNAFGQLKEDNVHFCVGDKNMFRLETDLKQRDAVSSFDNEETATAMVELFDYYFSGCKVID